MSSEISKHDKRISEMTFSAIYPLYVSKVESKGRTEEELLQVICWLTRFDESQIRKHIAIESTFEEFFSQADLNPHAHLITGVVCGLRVENIENSLTQKVRYLDKLVDELSRGKKVAKILRS